MNKKLLRKTTGSYVIFSIIILLVAAPLFYLVSRQLYLKEADETLLFHQKEFLQKAPALSETDIASWNRINRNVQLIPATTFKADSIYHKIYYDTLEAEYEPYREIISTISIHQKPYYYVERVNLVESEDLMKSIAFLFVSVILVLLIGLYIISSRQSKKMWQPFYHTLQQIENFEIDKSQSVHFRETDIEEFTRLNNSIHNLVEKNSAIYKSQREFIDNAAHELQTPLAIFQAKIDNMMQSAGITEEQSALLGSIHENISRLNKLNKNLLLLSNMQEDSYYVKQPILLNNIIEKQMLFFKEQAEAKGIVIATNMPQAVEVSSNAVLAEVMLSNLFLNAVRHNERGGQIDIKLQPGSLVFSNTGPGGQLDNEKLFKRFSKNNPSGTGNGLGLAIIKKIVQLNGWTINYQFANGLHSFSVQFS